MIEDLEPDLSILTPVDWVYPNGSQHSNDQYHVAFFLIVYQYCRSVWLLV